MSDTPRISAGDWRRDALKSRTEADVVADARQWLDAQRIPYSLTDATISYNAKGQRVVRVGQGWPDLTICHQGRFVAAEAKRPVGGKLRYDQAVMLARLHKAGGVVVVFRGTDELQHALRLLVTPAAALDEIRAAIAKGPEKARKKPTKAR